MHTSLSVSLEHGIGEKTLVCAGLKKNRYKLKKILKNRCKLKKMSFQTKNRCQLKESLQAKRIAANKCGRSLEIKTADRRKLKQSIPANHVKNTTGELPLAALMDTTEGI